MNKKKNNEFPFSALKDFTVWLESKSIKGIIIGGIAASILGRPRITHDIDSLIIIKPELAEEFIKSGVRYGFIPRIKNINSFLKRTNVMLMKHKATNIDIDISMAFLPFEFEAIERSERIKIKKVNLPLPKPEDLIILKAVAHRQKDLLDIESIIEINPKLNLKRIRKWVSDFSDVLEMPEILDDLEKILVIKKHKKSE